MRTKKLTVLVLVGLLVIGLSACNVDNDRDLTQGYNNTSPDGLAPYTLDNDNNYRNGTMNNRNGFFNDRDGLMNDRFDNNNNRLANRYNRYGVDRYGDMGLMDDEDNRRLTRRNYTANRFPNRQAEKLANQAARVNGVDDATVVISGKMAYVALDLKDEVATNQSSRIEREVYQKLKNTANGYNISITSDADLFGRLRDIGDGLRNGNRLDQYNNDFRDFGDRFNDEF